MELTGKQRRFLRGVGHNLSAVVQIGKDGVTEGVERAVHMALEQHELIKVRLLAEAPDDRHAAAERLAGATASAAVQVLGRTILLYRRHPKEPKIVLPRA